MIRLKERRCFEASFIKIKIGKKDPVFSGILGAMHELIPHFWKETGSDGKNAANGALARPLWAPWRRRDPLVLAATVDLWFGKSVKREGGGIPGPSLLPGLEGSGVLHPRCAVEIPTEIWRQEKPTTKKKGVSGPAPLTCP